MVIVLPIVGTDSGVVGCEKVVTALEVIVDGFNSHDHVTEGLNIPSAAIDINADLSFQDNRLTSAQGVGFQTQASFPTPPRGLLLFTLHSAPRDDLWFNDGVSDIQITSGGGILTSLDGFVDDYVNNVLGSGKAGYSIGSNTYTFSNGDNATGAIASSVSHVSMGRMQSFLDFGELSSVVGTGDNGAGADTDGSINIRTSAVNSALVSGVLSATSQAFSPTNFAHIGLLSPIVALTTNSNMYLGGATAEMWIDGNSHFSGNILPDGSVNQFIGSAAKEWENAYTESIQTSAVSTNPGTYTDATPHNRNSMNSIVARGSFDVIGAADVDLKSGGNHWNIDEPNCTYALGEYGIQLHENVSDFCTVNITCDGDPGSTTAFVGNGDIDNGGANTIVRVHIREITGGATTTADPSGFHLTVSGG